MIVEDEAKPHRDYAREGRVERRADTVHIHASRKEANAMTADDIFLDNAMTVQSKEHGERRKGQALRKLRKSLENDLLDLREAQVPGASTPANQRVASSRYRLHAISLVLATPHFSTLTIPSRSSPPRCRTWSSPMYC